MLSKIFVLLIVTIIAVVAGFWASPSNREWLEKMSQDPPAVAVKGMNWVMGTLASLSSTVTPPPAYMIMMAAGFFKSQAVYVAAKLAVADHLEKGPLTIEQLAQKTNVKNPKNLYRILRALTSAGVFREKSKGVFENTKLSDVLRTNAPDSVRYSVLHFVGQTYAPWEHLIETVDMKEGDPVKYYGEGDFWSAMDANKDESFIFDMAMKTLSMKSHAWMSKDYDFSQYKTIVDIGGGEGALLRSILENHPGVKGILFDRPLVIDHAKSVWSKSSYADRIQLVPGDFFDKVPVGDAYLLRFIIHDWNDADAIRILKTIRKAIGNNSNATLILIEQPIEEGVYDPVMDARWLDLQMLAVLNSKERTLDEYRAIYEASGFQLTGTFRSRAPSAMIIGKPK